MRNVDKNLHNHRTGYYNSSETRFFFFLPSPYRIPHLLLLNTRWYMHLSEGEIASQHVPNEPWLRRATVEARGRERKNIWGKKTKKQIKDKLWINCILFFILCFYFLNVSSSFSPSVSRRMEREKEAYTSVRFNAASSYSALVSHGVHHQ